jgi:hypothetical protein
MEEFKTRAGLVPAQNQVFYEITTEQAEQFLQQRINHQLKVARQKSGNNNIPDITIRLRSAKMSEKFAPMILMMPTSVLINSHRGNNDEPSIFSPTKTDGTPQLHKPLYDLLKSYGYTKEDINSMFRAQFRNALKLKTSSIHTLKMFASPRLQKYNKNRNSQVIMAIDPIALFHDMLIDPSFDRERFTVDIQGWTEIDRTGNYKYSINRVRTTKKFDPDENDLYKQITGMISGRTNVKD